MTTQATQVVAVDWSGRLKGAEETIWVAQVVDGRLVELENGLGREDAIKHVIELAAAEPRTIVGLDFAFSFPAWYCRRRDWSSGRDVWTEMRARGDQLLASCEPPFWGRSGTTAQRFGEPLRATERLLVPRPKSVFQIAGAGTVGTGSMRGMPHLLTLAGAGFSIWPFEPATGATVVEIYPRLFAPDTIKRRHLARREHLKQCFPDQCAVLRERAAGSEDAFDAAVSALVMAEHLAELERLPAVPADAPEHIEGAIWRPSVSTAA